MVNYSVMTWIHALTFIIFNVIVKLVLWKCFNITPKMLAVLHFFLLLIFVDYGWVFVFWFFELYTIVFKIEMVKYLECFGLYVISPEYLEYSLPWITLKNKIILIQMHLYVNNSKLCCVTDTIAMKRREELTNAVRPA